jgi:hypothetical protein
MTDPLDALDQRLAELGLDGPEFDPAAIRADLADRLATDASLNALVGPGDPGPSRAFRAEDYR